MPYDFKTKTARLRKQTPTIIYTRLTNGSFIVKMIALSTCQAVVNNKQPNYEAVDFKLTNESPGCLILNVVVKKGVSFSHEKFLVKTANNPEEAQHLNAEIIAYKILGSQDFMLKCFYAKHDEMLILEEPSQEGFSKEKLFGEDHIFACLETIAKLHLVSLLRSKVEGIDVDNSVKDWSRQYEKVLEAVEDEKEKDTLGELQERLLSLTSSKEFRKVLCHGDMGKSNVLFKYKNGSIIGCKLTDFEQVCLQPPVYDIITFILNTVESNQRNFNFYEYTAFYYKKLKIYLQENEIDIEDVLPWENFESSIRYITPLLKLRYIYENTDTSSDMLRDLTWNPTITPEDIFLVLKKKLGHSNFELTNKNLKPFESKLGFLGEHFRLTLEVATEDKLKNFGFFVKTLPKAQSQKIFLNETGVAMKETAMFSKLIPLLKQHGINLLDDVVPSCYLSTSDGLLIADDLSLDGYKTLNKQLSLEYGTAKLAVIALAKFHSSFLILEEKISLKEGREYRIPQEFSKEIAEVFYSEHGQARSGIEAAKLGMHALVDTFNETDGMPSLELKELITKSIDDNSKLLRASKKYRNTLCHADAWINNLMFKYENGNAVNCAIVDFQSYRYCPPANDLLHVLYLNTDREFRDKYLDEMLTIYYEEMKNCFDKYDLEIDAVVPRDAFYDSCRFYKLSALSQASLHFQIIMISEENITQLFQDPDEIQKVFFQEQRYNFVRDMLKIDPMFKKRNYEALLDLKEYFETIHR